MMADTKNTLILGVSCRLPKSHNINEFWENLIEGRDMIDKLRFPEGLYDIPPRGGLIPDLDKFDAEYFNYSFDEAQNLNIMLRHLLEVTYECVVDSGISEKTLQEDKTGLYCACFLPDCDPLETSRSNTPRQCTTVPQLTGHVMNKFGWTGPTVNVDTACSSSISALEMAHTDLMIGRCKYAVVAGVNLILNPVYLQQMKLLGMLSPEGQSRVFDRDANGYVRAEGVVAILLTRNEPEKCTRVYASVVDVMTNCDGYTADGITYPNGEVQQQLLRALYSRNNILPTDISYMELHSTGTRAGDPVEVGAISCVLCEKRTSPLLVGSVKSNMGHSEATAGLASLVKCLLAARHGIIPPQLNYEHANPRISAVQENKVTIIDKPTALPDGFVCLNSFGFGGANGHLILKPYHSKMQSTGQKYELVLHAAQGEEERAEISSFLNQPSVQENEGITRLLSSSVMSHDPKRPIKGYTVMGTAVKENVEKTRNTLKGQSSQKFRLHLNDLMLDKLHVSPDLLEIPGFRRSFERSDQILKEKSHDALSLIALLQTGEHVGYPYSESAFCLAVATQIGIVDCLKETGIEMYSVSGSGLSGIVAAYVDDGLTQEESICTASVIGKALELWKEKLTGEDYKIYRVHLQSEVVMELGDHSQVLSCTEEESVLLIHTQYLQEVLNSIHQKGGFYQELVDALPLYSSLMSSQDVKHQLWETILNPKLSSDRLLREERSSDQINPVKYDAEYFSQLVYSPHRHLVQSSSSKDLVTLTLDLGSSKKTRVSEDAPVLHCTADPLSLLSLVGEVHLMGKAVDIDTLYETHMTLDVKAPSISHLVKWDHSVSWYLPQWHEFYMAAKNKGIIPYTIKMPESECINMPLSIVLYHTWIAVQRNHQPSEKDGNSSMGVELCNLTFPNDVTLTCEMLDGALIQVQSQKKAFTVYNEDMVLLLGDFKIHKENMELPRIPGYDLDHNENMVLNSNDDDLLQKTEILWEDSWQDFINTALEFAMQHLKGPLNRVLINPQGHDKELHDCANILTVAECFTGLCKAGSGLVIQTLVTQASHDAFDYQRKVNIGGTEQTIISMMMAYSIQSNNPSLGQDKVLLYQGKHKDSEVKVIGIVLVTDKETLCREIPVDEAWPSEDVEQLVPFILAHYIVCTLAEAKDGKRFLICPPIDTVAVYIMTIADQLGSVIFTSSYDVEVRQMLDSIFPFARVLPGPRIVQNVKSLTQSDGCDVCIKFTSGGLDEILQLVSRDGKMIQCTSPPPGETISLDFLKRNAALVIPDITNAFRILMDKSLDDIKTMLYNIQRGSISKLTAEGFPEPKGLTYNLEDRFMFERPILFTQLLSLIEEPRVDLSDSFAGGMMEADFVAMEKLMNIVSTKPKDFSMAEPSPSNRKRLGMADSNLLNVARNYTPSLFSSREISDFCVVSMTGITADSPCRELTMSSAGLKVPAKMKEDIKITSTPMITVTQADSKPDDLHESYIENVAPSKTRLIPKFLNKPSKVLLSPLKIHSSAHQKKSQGIDLLFSGPPPTPRTPAVHLLLTPSFADPTLVPLNEKKGPKTLFIVHPITGKLTLLEKLGKSLDAQVYGIQRTDSTPRDTFPNVASYYLNAVEMKDRNGPYHLIGYSFGTLIAMEMAMQIQESGRQVHDLILLDGGPNYFRAQIKHRDLAKGETDVFFESMSLMIFLQMYIQVENPGLVVKILSNLPNLETRIQTVVDMTFKNVAISCNTQQTQWMTAKHKLFKSLKNKKFRMADAAQEVVRLKRQQAAEDFLGSLNMLKIYKTDRKFNGDIHLLRIKDDPPVLFETLSTDYGLKDCCTGNVYIKFYNGTHETFMNETEVVQQIMDLVRASET